MKCKSIVTILLCLFCHVISAQSFPPLKYLVQKPAITSPHPPVIILLHGYGSNEADLFALKDNLPKNFLVISVRGPFPVAKDAYQWYRRETINNDLKTSSLLIQNFITDIVNKYHADAGNVYLSGFSQGAMLTYEVGLNAPQLLKGIAPLSGRLVESMKPQEAPSEALKKLRIFVGHGDADNRILYSQGVDAVNYLKKLQLSPEFHTYKGMTHSISEQELKDLAAWLNDHT